MAKPTDWAKTCAKQFDNYRIDSKGNLYLKKDGKLIPKGNLNDKPKTPWCEIY